MDQVALVRERTDIVNLISSYIPLKKMGNNFKANCPFHGEKTPSFVVSPERQIWHCFGCNLGGDVFSFLMQYERIEFPEALRILAEKAGVQLTQQPIDNGLSSKKELLYRLNNLAAEYYHFLLTKHPIGKTALAYLLSERKIKPQTIDTYMLGFAPFSGKSLTQYLIEKKKYKADDLLEAGLATKRIGGVADFFQGRLMFPLYDHRGNIIGFSGRVLDKEAKTSKYINTKETIIYHKGSVFFGLNSSKESIKKANQAIIMEGEFDVIAAFQEGITNCVAIKGTAFTIDQAKLISRFAKIITMCLDSDSAGQEAMKRSLPILEKEGLTTTMIVIPDGKDPDEAIKTDPISFKKAIKADRPAYEVILEQLLTEEDVKTIGGKKHIADVLLPLFANISNEIVKEHFLKMLSQAIGSSVETLTREMERQQKQLIVKQQVVIAPAQKRPREAVLEEYLTALILQHSQPVRAVGMIDELASYVWFTPAYQKIMEHIKKFVGKEEIFTPQTLLAGLPQELVETFDRCFLLPLPEFPTSEDRDREIALVTKELADLGLRRSIKELNEAIEVREKEGKEDDLPLLQGQLSELLKKMKKEK